MKKSYALTDLGATAPAPWCIGVKLTKLTNPAKWDDHFGVPVESPYNPEHHRSQAAFGKPA